MTWLLSGYKRSTFWSSLFGPVIKTALYKHRQLGRSSYATQPPYTHTTQPPCTHNAAAMHTQRSRQPPHTHTRNAGSVNQASCRFATHFHWQHFKIFQMISMLFHNKQVLKNVYFTSQVGKMKQPFPFHFK